MLKSLSIQNLILIERAEIEFGDGLNIFTGETGAGKSVVLSAIRLITGARADPEWIRSGAPCAVIEARLHGFDPSQLGEIEIPPAKDDLFIRREIHRSGKNRCFVEDQLVSASCLRLLTQSAVEIVNQSSAHFLSTPTEQNNLLDTFAQCISDRTQLEKMFEKQQLVQKRLNEVMTCCQNRTSDLARAKTDLQMIEETHWQKGEEDDLHLTHTALVNAHQCIAHFGVIIEGLEHTGPQIRRLAHLLTEIARLHPQFSPLADTLKKNALELEESKNVLSSHVINLEADPQGIALIERRIGEIERLKRRFGPTWDDVEQRRIRLIEEIDRLTHLDEIIRCQENELKQLKQQNREIALRLSEQRKENAMFFSKQIVDELKGLNLPNAQFTISITEKPMTPTGIDEIVFLFSANPGINPLPLDQCASGGELSRLLLAIKTVLAGKEGASCLIFDEIDSNIGGQTAVVLGEKLKTIAKNRQVVCITHFTQVARAAQSHFGVTKQENQTGAMTTIMLLVDEAREREYQRMLGYTRYTSKAHNWTDSKLRG